MSIQLNQLQEAFFNFDTDRDGFISCEDMKLFLMTKGSKMTQEETDEEEKILKTFSEYLAKKHLSESDIWCANPKVIPILKKCRSLLDRLNRPDKPTLLCVSLGDCQEFQKRGFNKTIYRIDENKTVHQAISMILKKNSSEFDSPHKYALISESGQQLDDNLTLAQYGLGTLFKYWELKIMKKTSEQILKTTVEEPEQGQQYYATILIADDSKEFTGVNQVKLRVKLDTKVEDVINIVCRRYSVKNSQKWTLVSPSNMLLSSDKPLSYYGLGNKITKMSLKLCKRDKVVQSNHRTMSPNVAWTQVDEQISLSDARLVIIDLDEKIFFLKDQLITREAEFHEFVEKSNFEQKKLIQAIFNQDKRHGELVEEHNQLKDRAKRLVEICTKANEEQELLFQKNSELEYNVNLISKELEDHKKLLKTKEQKISDLNISISDLQNEKRIMGEKNEDQRVYFESILSQNEDKICELKADLAEQNEKNIEMYRVQISRQEEIAQLKSSINSLESDMNTAKNKLSQSEQKNISLSEQINQLNQANFELEYEKQNLVSQMNFINQDLAHSNSLFEELNQAKSELEKDFYNYKLQTNEKISSIQQDLESAINEKKDVEVNFEIYKNQTQERIKDLENQSSKYSFHFSEDQPEIEKQQKPDCKVSDEYKLETLEAQNQYLNRKIEALKLENQNKEKRIQDMIEDNENMKSKVSSLQSSLNDSALYQKQTESLREQFNQQKKQFLLLSQSKEDEIRFKDNKIAVLIEKVDTLESTLQKLMKECEAVSSASEELFNELNAKISKLRSEKADQEKAISNRDKTINDYDKIIKNYEYKVASFEEKIKVLENKVEELMRPPEPPPIPKDWRVPDKIEKKPNSISLEREILNMKDVLSIIDKPNLKKPVEEYNFLASIIMKGLNSRFKSVTVPDDVHYEDLSNGDDW